MKKLKSKTVLLIFPITLFVAIFAAAIFFYPLLNINHSEKIQVKYPNAKILTDQDIQDELNYLSKNINLHPDKKDINENNYPKFLGLYQKNNLPLEEIYYCSDLCPDYGRVLIVYEGIKTKEECEKINGIVEVDPAWEGYIGCRPNLKK